MAIDNWENQVLGSFSMIKRCISIRHDEFGISNIQKLEDILKEMRNFKVEVEVPETISIKGVKKTSDKPLEGATSEVGESSNSRVKELKEQNSPAVNTNPNEGVSDLPPKSTTSEVGEPSNIDHQKDDEHMEFDNYFHTLNDVKRDCLCSLAIFPKNTELKRRLLEYWWIGLGLNQSVEMFFFQLEDDGILIPKQIKKHNQAVDSYTINPTFHSRLISKFMLKVDNRVAPLQPDMDRVMAVLLNLNQKHLNSGYIGKIIPTITVVQLGKWRYPDHEVHNKTEKAINDCIYASGTNFLEKIGETVTYLSLRGISKIEELPQSFGKKKSLKILDLKDCHSLQKLPQKPKSMIRAAICKDDQWFKELTHLDITGCYLLDHMPKWICELSNLQVLKGAVFHGMDIPNQSRLKHISKLQKLTKLSIKIIHSHLLSPDDCIGLKSLSSLLVLTIVWHIQERETMKQCGDKMKDSLNTVGTDNKKLPSDSEVQDAVTKKQSEEKTISFPENLEKLDMRCYPYAEAPEQLRASKLKHLKRLYLRGGKLAKIYADQQVEILRLRFLNCLDFDWYELGQNFTKLRCVEYKECPLLKFFPGNSGCWSKKDGEPSPTHMGPFNDDEPIPPQNSDPSKSNDQNISPPSSGPDKVQISSAQTSKSYLSYGPDFKRVDLKLQSSNTYSKEKPQLDLVMVLDLTRSMEGEKLEMMKSFIKSFIKNLTRFRFIRLSIVTFGTEAKGQCGLRLVTKNYQTELQKLKGLEVLKDRRFCIDRTTGIMLVSGSNNIDDDAEIPIGYISVHTVGIGQDYNKMVLESIAAKSIKGTLTDVPNTKYLTKALNMCLIRLLNLEVQDLTLTIAPIKGISTIKEVNTEIYQQSTDNTDGSVIVNFGNLYGNDVRTATVGLNLDTSKIITNILQISYSYKFKGKQFEANIAMPTYGILKSLVVSFDMLVDLLPEVCIGTTLPPGLTPLLYMCTTEEDTKKVNNGQNLISVLEQNFDQALKVELSGRNYKVGLVLTLALIHEKKYAKAQNICYELQKMTSRSDRKPSFILDIINMMITGKHAEDLHTMRTLVYQEGKKYFRRPQRILSYLREDRSHILMEL